ncbi:DUF1579 domain-containing protein [Pseudoduganella plicata]|uniref:DUF1579 domain-containing protein n=1 Tax=Pseudoduganella plicata TaxID=321984 RepID=A0A4P7BHC0_9BURK|nr:DUF1579 domain-containing protein [Pseudoduganella plicata]QBQ38154.1 DUF1579 domain-containing protein [Pseudoduganella plicata]GGZ02469.1 hypothetical protein GCM10007388_40100 [Pseudoduganella plicata]
MPLPLAPAAPPDFDFIIGDWEVRHRRLRSRLTGCTEWEEFDGLSSTVKTLGGFGNLEDNLLRSPDGEFRAIAVRSYCRTTQTWSIWWLDGRNPTALDVPVTGKFNGDTGLFFADDVLDGQAIRVRFTWTGGARPRWEQAFSNDGGVCWETNWTMTFGPVKA